jgi:hypothetical protein
VSVEPPEIPIRREIARRYLLPGEQVVVSTRRHWASLVPPVGAAVLALVLLVAGAVSGAWGEAVVLLWWGFVGVTLWATWKVLQWQREWFIATERRMLKVYGLVTHRVAMMPLVKVTDMRFDRSIMGRLLGYGEFVMESAGQDQALSRIEFVPHPDRKYQAMCQTIFGRDMRDHGEDTDSFEEDADEVDDAPDRGRWESVQRDELPPDWAWVDDDAEPRPVDSPTYRAVAVDPDPTPWR